MDINDITVDYFPLSISFSALSDAELKRSKNNPDRMEYILLKLGTFKVINYNHYILNHTYNVTDSILQYFENGSNSPFIIQEQM